VLVCAGGYLQESGYGDKAMTTNPIELAIFKSAMHSIAEEMGAALRRTAFSPNIKERRDYSCAIFNGDGDAIAMGDHMPVHLGSMPMSVREAINHVRLGRGDVAILNDPYAGGTHLPDITMVLPVFADDEDLPIFYVAARAHHADVGGYYPGSMGPCREIYQEGIRIPPVKIVQGGAIVRDVLNLLLYNVRTPQEREGDLFSQIGACKVGEARLHDVIKKYGSKVVELSKELLDYSERLVRAELARMPVGTFAATDFLDDDGVSETPIAIRVSIQIDPSARSAKVDFSGSDAQINSSINAVYAITYSAVYYVFRCLLSDEAPASSGIMRPIEVIAPLGTIVNARPPAAVAGGNVETSQRIVDVLLRALAKAIPDRIPAASSGTMNNLTIGGIDTRTNTAFAYYETVAGGMGARPNSGGLSGVHTHMTNSLNTPAEALEYAYPLRVRRYSYRARSGGTGQYRGGDGLVREIELLDDAQITLLTDRRRLAPYGLAEGGPGATGTTKLVRPDGVDVLPGKCSVNASKGDIVRIETPGGGGWGVSPDSRV
jgi:N-methylhydantoinase B